MMTKRIFLLGFAKISAELRPELCRYQEQTADQMTAVDNDLMREQHPSMPISKPERQTRVTFGGNDSSKIDK